LHEPASHQNHPELLVTAIAARPHDLAVFDDQAAHEPAALERDRHRQLASPDPFEHVFRRHGAERTAQRHPFEHSGSSGTLSVMADAPKTFARSAGTRAIVIDPRVLFAGGAVALIGLALLAFFLWMVPNAAAREVKAACTGLRATGPA